ncbi:GNAT family N-acetyltransferase [Romboutsia sp. 1001216sp1]|uniref:GNAT family N-acetyltransferase n=1 Tax=Romboutsia TaxID=1501226 RepID=UPI000ADE5F3C|nr:MULTISPECIES: GNAT family N-acetyltransferase [Romboutsia]MDB8789678.1 GNAT family N-acetyltransferase [Romboutsia sp. 1001216sp1]MDB8801826.1 GNAT family N-acetyltransferase [Romboutsia sp. 1001216sp1]MDB8813223.1 GNAT family N-acetyltransferase [Romboutsia sp. 1001216sp1]
MILKIDEKYHKKVVDYLSKEPEFNLFIVGDIERFGYDNSFFSVWADIDRSGNIEGVLVKYLDFLTFYSHSKFNVKRFSNFIDKLDYTEISGKTACLEKFEKNLNINRKRIVSFCKLLTTKNLENTMKSANVKKIRFGNIGKVVKLYEVIEEFENTTVENIKNLLKTGRGYYIPCDKQVVAMAKSTLESQKYGLIVGVGTHPNYRNKGYATVCISKLCRELLEEGKIPCLFYDNEEAGKIYRKLGFKEIGKWSIYYA